MNKLLASFALLGLGLTAGVGTPIESSPAVSVPSQNFAIKKKISMGPTQPSFRYFLLSRTVVETTDMKATNTDGMALIASSDLSSDAHTGFSSLKLEDNNTLGIRFGYSAVGGYTFSFWAKNLASGASKTSFSIRFDNYTGSDEESRAYYAKMSVTETVDGWSHYSYSFERLVSSRPSMSLTSYGSWLIDDIELTDANGVNYVMDGDFETTEMMDYQLVNAGMAKQSDGSVIIGFSSFNCEYNAENASSGGYNEAYFQIKPTANVESMSVSFDYCGKKVGVMNRNGYETLSYTNDANDGLWKTYSGTFAKPGLSTSDIYFGHANVGWNYITYVKNISFKDASGNEFLPEQLTKEGYAKSFAETIRNSLTCDGGTTAPSTSTWGDIRYCFERMPLASQAYIKSLTPDAEGSEIEQALYKYSFIVSKYGDKYYDYLGYRGTSKAIRSIAGDTSLSSSDANLYCLLAFGGLALACTAGIMLFKKKHQA